MQKLIIGLIILGLLAVGGFFISQSAGDNGTNNTAQETTENTENQQPTNEEAQETAIINYNGGGFNPETLTVSVGDTVTVTNTSSETMQFDSNPHPAHTDNPELNIEIIEPGESKSFTANTAGTYGYHNHLNESQTGTLIVE